MDDNENRFEYHSNRNVYQTIFAEFEVGNSKMTYTRKILLMFGSVVPTRRGKQVTTFSRCTDTLVRKFGRVTDPTSEELKLATIRITYIPKISVVLVSQSKYLLEWKTPRGRK